MPLRARRLKANSKGRRKAVIYDIDGVLCDSAEAITEWARLHPETLDTCWEDFEINHPPIIGWVKLLRMHHADGFFIVILTARTGSARAKTEAWLAEHGIPHDLLLMWEEDSAHGYFEHKLQETRVLTEYLDIELAIDDSSRHCASYRELGIPTIHARGFDG